MVPAPLTRITAPSFRGLAPASESSAQAKRMNTSVGTAHEKALRSLLWRSGHRFRANVKTLPGKPDIVFSRQKVAIFCDGDFWHGRHWSRLSRKLANGSNSTYWIEKVRTNRARDRRTNALLRAEGWRVLRFWETDIHRDAEAIVLQIANILKDEVSKNDRKRS
jgi:DNA mismatch endonuclease (patch repair protein)